MPVVVAINRFESDTPEEIEAISDFCAAKRVPAAISDVVLRGGEGGVGLAPAPSSRPSGRAAAPNGRSTNGTSRSKKKSRASRNSSTGPTASGTRPTPSKRSNTSHAAGSRPPPCLHRKNPALPLRRSGTQRRPEGVGSDRAGNPPESLGAGFLVCLTGDVMTMPGLPQGARRLPYRHWSRRRHHWASINRRPPQRPRKESKNGDRMRFSPSFSPGRHLPIRTQSRFYGFACHTTIDVHYHVQPCDEGSGKGLRNK